MQSANTIIKRAIKLTLFSILLFPVVGFSQLNSPYSRYGVGNLSPQGNIGFRAMGGIGAAIADPNSQNLINPASYANLYQTNLDFALEYNGMNLKSKEPIANFKSNYTLFSYLSLGMPLLNGNKKALRKDIGWAMVFGLKPETVINYKIATHSRNSIDSVSNIFEGEGGVNKAYFGSALRLKNFNFGFNSGYLFGEKDYSTQLFFNNDSIRYSMANYKTKSQFGGVFLDLGAQYKINLKKDTSYLRLGVYTNLNSTYTAKRSQLRETFVYGEFDDVNRVDSIYEKTGEKGKITLPSTIGFGIAYEDLHLLIGADYQTSKWSDYRFFGQSDLTQNSWIAKAGFQYYPATTSSTNYFNFVKYRLGFSFGEDYIKVDNSLPFYTVSFGAAFPLRLKRSFYDRQFSLMNVTFEYGSRGNKNNNITESTYKLSLGFSLSDFWFFRQKYQ